MKVYEQYCKWPIWIRWIFFLPLSFIGAGLLAWAFRFAFQFLSPFEISQIIIDLTFPALCQYVFLCLVFFTVPRWKMGWVISFFVMRTLFSISYIVLGITGLLNGVETTSGWEYWKAGIAELIVFFTSLSVFTFLKDEDSQDSGFYEEDGFSEISEQIAERHNKYGVTLTDPQTGADLLAGMTSQQRENYRQHKINSNHTRQEQNDSS